MSVCCLFMYLKPAIKRLLATTTECVFLVLTFSAMFVLVMKMNDRKRKFNMKSLWILFFTCISIKDIVFIQRYEDDSVVPTADFAKLWYHFYRIEGSGLAGVFITTFIYLGFCFVTGAFLYMYFLR